MESVDVVLTSCAALVSPLEHKTNISPKAVPPGSARVSASTGNSATARYRVQFN